MHNKFTGEIDAVRTALRQFDCKQTDFAVRFHVAIVDANLRAASEGHDDPIFREGFALCVHHLAESLRNPGTDAVLSGTYFVRESCTSRYSLKIDGNKIPLELVGAGALQGNSACSLCHDV
jgi:hypothetical protein